MHFGFFFFLDFIHFINPFREILSSLLSVTVSPQSSATNAPSRPVHLEATFFFILTHMQGVAGAYHKLIVYSWVPILQGGWTGESYKLLSQGNYNMAWLGIEPATTRSRVRRANHSATLPQGEKYCIFVSFRPVSDGIINLYLYNFGSNLGVAFVERSSNLWV